MRHARFVLSSIGLLFGFSILAVSLSAGNSTVLSSTPSETSKKQFYVNQTVLPDHVAYPVLMAVDRVKLELNNDQERVYTQIDYAHRRFDYAQALMEKNNLSLALTTITKAEKYLIQAAHDALRLGEDGRHQQQYVYKTLVYYDARLEELKPIFPDGDRDIIDQLQQEIKALKLQLESILS